MGYYVFAETAPSLTEEMFSSSFNCSVKYSCEHKYAKQLKVKVLNRGKKTQQSKTNTCEAFKCIQGASSPLS